MKDIKTFEDLFEENFNLIPKFENEKLIFKFEDEIYEITSIMYYDKNVYCWKNYTGNMQEIIDNYLLFNGFDNKKLSFFVPYSLYTDCEPKYTLYFDTITPMPNDILTFNLLKVHENCNNKCGLIIRRKIPYLNDAEFAPFLVPEQEKFLSERPVLTNVDRRYDYSNILEISTYAKKIINKRG